MQLWDYMGRLMLDEPLLAEMEQHGKDDEAVFNKANRRDGFRMSRAEISDAAGLLGQPVFRKHARFLGARLRQALQDANFADGDLARDLKFRKVREVIGLLCIDDPMLSEISSLGSGKEVQAAMARHNFPLELHEADVVRRVMGKGGTGIPHGHAIHLCWSPPDCYSALTFSRKFQRCHKGGVRRTIIHEDGLHQDPVQAV
jgi:hypothetical protein